MTESDSNWLSRIGRDRPFTRLEQLSLVGASHAGILLGTFAIVEAFDIGSGLPLGFLLGEIAVLLLAAPFVTDFPFLGKLFRLAAGPPSEKAGEASNEEWRERAAGYALILASIAQFVALAFLLWGTGGPIESPFAEMTLIIAVFTPYIANNPRTIGFVVLVSVTFYAVLILLYTSTYAIESFEQVLAAGAFRGPDPVGEFKEALASFSPSEWSYFFVNVMILVGGIMFAVFESMLRKAEMTAATDAAAGGKAGPNGEGAAENISPPADDDLDEDATPA